MKWRAQIKEIAKNRFQERYGMCVGATLLFGLLEGMSLRSGPQLRSNVNSLDNFLPREMIPVILTIFFSVAGFFFLVSIFVGGPMTVGYSKFSICIYMGYATSVGDMFRSGFRDYWRSVGGMLWMRLFIWLWSLLFIIPGIVKFYAYFATPYILAEFPFVSPTEALKISMRMTNGYKGEIFVMSLSFIGWFLLSGITFGLVGLLYVNPYYYTSMAGMYDELKMNALAAGTVRIEELTGYSGRAA